MYILIILCVNWKSVVLESPLRRLNRYCDVPGDMLLFSHYSVPFYSISLSGNVNLKYSIGPLHNALHIVYD